MVFWLINCQNFPRQNEQTSVIVQVVGCVYVFVRLEKRKRGDGKGGGGGGGKPIRQWEKSKSCVGVLAC